MNKEEIKDYLKRVDELELKLTGEDRETYRWVLFGYNECARLLEKKEQENKELHNKIDKAIKRIELLGKFDGEHCTRNFKMMSADFNYLLKILKDSDVDE